MLNIMKLLLVVVTLLAIVLSTSATSATIPAMTRYDDFKVYRVFVKDEQQLNEFKKLSNTLPVRHLKAIGGIKRNYDIVIDRANQEHLEEFLQSNEFEFDRVIDNLQEFFEDKYNRNYVSTSMDWTNYHSLNDIYNWLDDLASKNKKIVKSYTIGYSYEGRPIKAVKISSKKRNKAIFIDSNIHAIEWISSAASTCFFDNLLKSKDPEIRNLAKNYDWIFVPVVNPDGFEYTHNVEPLWRKNRKPTGFSNSSGICYGTDLNRNFDFHWGTAGWNVDVPCDHWYGGAAPNSEPEVIALQKFISSFSKKYIRMYIAMHSYGNLVLLPYGHTNSTLPDNYEKMERIGKAFGEGATPRYGTIFRTGASGVLLGNVSGAAKDWVYGVKNIPFSATLELRDTGEYGFFLPPSQILEVCEEVTYGLVSMVRKATEEGLFK